MSPLKPNAQRSPRPQSSPPFGPVQRFGDYTLIKKLATGGMAEIWLARQSGIAGFARFLVIKKILSHLAEQSTFVRMFQDEARTSALLSHPNIVHIHDLGQAEGTYFIAMEYIAGENLAAISWRGMKRGRPLPPSYAARVVADTCKALHHAHTLKGNDSRPLEIVHRDVSPQNILLTYEGDIKVVDFGIAKARTQREDTRTGMLKGKFSYMSPEQCLGHDIDRRSDIFSLGILLYELSTGKRLYKHASELVILEMITKRQVAPPSEVAPHISPELEHVIMRALEKDVDRRYQSAQDMQIALEKYLRKEHENVGHAELSAYMHALFADKIEEKRRLQERASRDDFESMFVEAAPQLAPTGTQNPLLVSPSVRNQTPGTVSPSVSYQEFLGGTMGSGRILLFIGLIMIVVATFSAVAKMRWGGRTQPAQLITQQPPESPPKTGAITLESSPSGAAIFLDGHIMKLADGSPARTPSDLKGLNYRQNYNIQLRIDGYRTQSLDILMNSKHDGRAYHPTLDPLPGQLITEVRGLGAHEVEIRYDGAFVGKGPRVQREISGNSTVLVQAEAEGKSCLATPRRVRVNPNTTSIAEIRCTPILRSKSRHRRKRKKSRAAHQKALVNKKSCAVQPDLPWGWVTIATTPYSTIYHGDHKLGETPIAKKHLPAGCVQLRAETTQGQTRTFTVKVEPNLVRVYRIEL